MAPALALGGLDTPLGAACATLAGFSLLVWSLFAVRPSAIYRFVAGQRLAIFAFGAALVCLLVASVGRHAFLAAGHGGGWLQAASLGAICFGAALLGMDRALARRAHIALASLGICYALVCLALWQWHGQGDRRLPDGWAVTRFAASLNNPNVAGCLFGMLAVLTLGWLLRTTSERPFDGRRAVTSIWIGLGLALLIGACGLTGSRASVAVSLASMTLLATACVLKRRTSQPAKIVVVTTAAAALIAVILTASSALQARGEIANAAHGRLLGLATYGDLSLRHPWLGMGPGAFRQISTAALDARSVDELWNFGAAHNALLQAGLEGGWPYALLAVGAVGLAGCAALRGGLNSRETTGLSMLFAALVAAACGLVDIAMNVPAIADLAMLLLGLSWGRAFGAGSHSQRPARDSVLGPTPSSALQPQG